ncbi:MAG: hypothetical protein ACRYFS_06905 [Janthinobacterium lividum]
MTVTLDLNAEEITILTSLADARSISIETVLHSIVAQLAPPQVTPDELAADAAEREEIQANLRRWHREEGRDPLNFTPTVVSLL